MNPTYSNTVQRPIAFRAFDDECMYYHSINSNYENIANFFLKIRPDAIVMQFTGVYDERDQPIYEGDILKTVKHNGLISQVKYIQNAFWRYSVADNGREYINPLGNCAVICVGNIYQTPQLIKQTP